MKLTKPIRQPTVATIFARVWETSNGGLSPTLAQHIVRLGFSPADQTRMHELARRNETGQLSATELNELDSYVQVGDLLAILQSKARKLLKQSRTA